MSESRLFIMLPSGRRTHTVFLLRSRLRTNFHQVVYEDSYEDSHRPSMSIIESSETTVDPYFPVVALAATRYAHHFTRDRGNFHAIQIHNFSILMPAPPSSY